MTSCDRAADPASWASTPARVFDEVQGDERDGGVAEDVVPIEDRQLLMGHPEDAEARGGREVEQQQHARDDVERVA